MQNVVLPALARMETFNVVFVGAGNVMFGSNQGPWDHSLRLEKYLGQHFKLIAVIDPAVERAIAALSRKRSSQAATSYQDTAVYATFQEFIDNSPSSVPTHAVVIGSPPMYRGSTQPGKDVEMQILKWLPGVAIFCEKPITTGPASDIQNTLKVAQSIMNSGVVCSAGYMLRYLKAVQEMKRIIQENKLTVMVTIARYACGYESIAKQDWWDKSKSAGPIVEQATHLCDLSRYFGGEVELTSISANYIGWDESVGHLSKIPVDESKIAPANRIPRATTAIWKYRSGAVGTLTHVLALQGAHYSCEFEVYADGYLFKLIDPYGHPKLHIRRHGNDDEEILDFGPDDPFSTEIEVFVDGVQGRGNTHILSSYEDACRSYEFSWAITMASERSR